MLRLGKQFTSSVRNIITHNRGMADELQCAIMSYLISTNAKSYPLTEDAGKNLEPRLMADSYGEFRISLSTDSKKRAEYLSANGNVRLGKIVEDLDRLAVWVAMARNRESTDWNQEFVGSLPRVAVTASVEKINMHIKELDPAFDIIMDGQMTWVGRTSMETSLRVFQEDENKNIQQVLKAKFLMVSRDPETGKTVPVHPLKATTVEEAAIMSAGENAMRIRMQEKSTSLFNSAPEYEEFKLIHEGFLNRRQSIKTGPNASEVLMHETRCEFNIICFPEFQNMYGKIFGGYQMRLALELAYATGKLFAKRRLHVICMDDITFKSPIEIGEMMRFTSHITYTKGKYVQTDVVAEAIDSKLQKRISNVFHFTMETDDGQDVPRIIPEIYAHSVMWLSGKRHMDAALTITQ